LIESGKLALRRADNAGVKKIAAALLLSSLVVAGCGGGSSGPSGPSAYTLASRACQTSGQAAADLAAQAAALDPKYAQLAADEKAVAASIGAQQGDGSDDDNLGGVTGELGTGTGSSAQVLADCANMARSLIPGSNQ
jgi:hypothetical protein